MLFLLFYIILKVRYNLIGVRFLSYTPNPDFGEILELSDASKSTSFGHINMPRILVIYFVCSKVQCGRVEGT